MFFEHLEYLVIRQKSAQCYLKLPSSQSPVAHACHPSHLGGRDHEDLCSKPAQANSSRDYILKIPNTARHWGLTPIMLTTQEAEIRRIEVQSQPQAHSSQNPISKKPITEKYWWSNSRCRP
jgi:hypothetical protein